MLRKILVVDNEGLLCDTCHTALGDAGFEIFCANEDQAVETAKKDSFSLVIVNGQHEGMTGINVFETLRQFNPTLAGILVVGLTSTDMVIEAMNKGFSRIHKIPLVAHQFVDAVNETLKVTDLREDITRMKILLPLYKLGQNFLSAESEQEIYEKLADAVVEELHVPTVSVMMFDNDAKSLKVVAYHGIATKYVEDLQIKAGEQIAGKVFQSQRPIILNKINQHQSPYFDAMKRKELSAAISLPIISREKVLGVLNISETKDGMQFKDTDTEMLAIIVDQAMIALENIRSIREREESSRIRVQLEQYVSPEVSAMLVQNNKNLLDVGHVQELTVLFADIRNFTLLVQNLEPTLLRVFLNSFFDMFANIVFHHHGMLDKFMGDAALVIFGAPFKSANPNSAAVSAGHQIMAAFEKLRILWEKEDTIFEKVGLGIGISRGPMFLGNVGSSTRLDYTVIGSDVNIAQRLASVTESGQILMTNRVNETLNGQFPVRAEKNMLLKGMNSEVAVYSLSSAHLK